MTHVTFFNDLLLKICIKLGLANIAINHAIEKVRCNGEGRRVTWIDAYDELKSNQNQMAETLAFHARRLSDVTRSIVEIEDAMIEKGVARCPKCIGKDWQHRSLKGTGNQCIKGDWKDCTLCKGTGVVARKKS